MEGTGSMLSSPLGERGGPQRLQFTLGLSVKSIGVTEEGTISKASEPPGDGLSLISAPQPQLL